MNHVPEKLSLICAGQRRGRSTSALKRGVDAGQLLRLTPGVFVETAAWIPAAPWIRHSAFIAAYALTNPRAIFCDRTALALYGIPLLEQVRKVHLRARSASRVGTVRPKPLTVPSAGPRLEAALRAAGVRWGPRRLISLPVQRSLPALPVAATHPKEKRFALLSELVSHSVEVPVPGVVLEDGQSVMARAEPLPEVLVSTVPGLSAQAAVVALDAALSGRYGFGVVVTGAALDYAERMLPNDRARRSWSWTRGFADARSESPGESRARVLFDELGFEPPLLQHRLYLPRIGNVRLDFFWEDPGIVGEFDGRVKYSRNCSGFSAEEALVAEKVREDGLRLRDLNVVRFMWDDLEHPPQLGRKLLQKGVPHRAITWRAHRAPGEAA